MTHIVFIGNSAVESSELELWEPKLSCWSCSAKSSGTASSEVPGTPSTFDMVKDPGKSMEIVVMSKIPPRQVLLLTYTYIRRPRPWPRQGRRLGPPQVWNFSFLAFQGRLPALKSHRLNIPLTCSTPSQQAPQGHTSMASYGRPSLPFASP